MLAAWIFLLGSVLTAQGTVNLATFTPLEDGTTTSTAFFFSSTSLTSSPTGCIDTCFNNATGGGKQGGCVGISGQYDCICTFPSMMQSFETCMSTTCALDSTTVQQTLGNVQQICSSCTPDGCSTFKISASRIGGGTIIGSATLAPVSTPSVSLCYSSTQSAWTSSAGAAGGAVGGGFFSAGPVACAASSSGVGPSSTVIALSDSASPTGTSPSSAMHGFSPYVSVFAATALALSLGRALV
ncbi:hypothetical protein B0H17DRAFT_1198139 [Mycena rosella]|uniref:CFEM domain-containing protein n=1 Tax=Mycena rosella TaxID=1033263 RepID=A0AAD7DPG9_MYCRO|nr:hypothetical protein B0H17DRAFT_1198139 [Mycena rosella]